MLESLRTYQILQFHRLGLVSRIDGEEGESKGIFFPKVTRNYIGYFIVDVVNLQLRIFSIVLGFFVCLVGWSVGLVFVFLFGFF